ncbi:FAD-binding domain-containing protein [Aspergillus egyptiacus]|nr:FAD-binding domain-containing protein [Aspergillus egyptiacus]
MGFWFRSWGRFIVFSSGRPIRRLGYEFFVLQHLVMFVGFTVAVWLHASPETKVWVWISIGLLVFDRTLRYIRGAYLNLSIFHGSSWSSHAWANRASFTPLPGNVTRVTIQNPRTSWAAGQHIFLTCHSIAPFQSHPFTIASIPEDNKMEFFIHAEKGATRRIFRYASKHDAILGNSIPSAERQTRTVFLEGPYGSLRPLRQFDSIVLIAGGMGATFTTPLLRDIVARWRSGTQSAQRTVTKRIRFIWVIRSRAHLVWFEAQLQSALVEVEARRRANPDWIHEIEIGVYLTCDETMDSPSSTPCLSQPGGQSPLPETTAPDTEKSAGENKDIQATEKSNRPACCCTTTIDAETQANPPPEIQCTCSGPASLQSRSPPTPMPIALQPGRPALRPLIRQALEKAEGESAVVVCGPVGLAEDVRHSVVYLSDERAVHKGTGAQGIYLHVEMFGW